MSLTARPWLRVLRNGHEEATLAATVLDVPIGDRAATRAPATRDQVDAYRFGLRRLEAALVRGDPVPLHEQIRSQRRAALASVVLGLLGVCGVAAYAVVFPSPDWRSQSVVVGAQSGAMYVVARGPDRLVPVANLPAARLVLAVLRKDAAEPVAAPVVVPDAALDAAPRTPTAAVPGAVAVRPDVTVAPRWAVCDTVAEDGVVVGTTVIGGAALAPADGRSEGALLEGPDGVTWLVTGGRRHRIDTANGRLMAAFGLARPVPRKAAAALVSLVPEGPALATPTVAGRGGPAPRGLPGKVGDVLVMKPTNGAPQYFVVLAGGLQRVSKLVAELLSVVSETRKILPIEPDVLAAATFVDELKVEGWPTGTPTVLDPADAPVLCWTWAAGGAPAGEVWLGRALPLGAGVAPVALAQADGPGEHVDTVAVGAGGAVRALVPGGAADAGQQWLVSATGVGYRIADAATAGALGVGPTEPAPEAALRLLPGGPPLDLAAAGRVVDVLG
jgi:type VII secretion protein EccB